MKKWIVIYFMLAFLVLYLATVFYQSDTPAKDMVIVPGTVVDISTHFSKGRRMYQEIISFEFDQKEYRFKRSVSSSIRPKLGRTRQLIVDPADPNNAHVRTWEWLEKITPQPLRHNPSIMYLWLIGCAFFAAGWFLSVGYYEFFRHAILVPGEVTSFVRDGRQYGASVSYSIDNQIKTVTSKFRSNKKPKIGTKCQVGIDPNNMQLVRIKEGLWFFVLFAGVGLLLWGIIFVPALID